jgi:hypothetical protein
MEIDRRAEDVPGQVSIETFRPALYIESEWRWGLSFIRKAAGESTLHEYRRSHRFGFYGDTPRQMKYE